MLLKFWINGIWNFSLNQIKWYNSKTMQNRTNVVMKMYEKKDNYNAVIKELKVEIIKT